MVLERTGSLNLKNFWLPNSNSSLTADNFKCEKKKLKIFHYETGLENISKIKTGLPGLINTIKIFDQFLISYLKV
ncbi:hypothetical protein BpHYR1_004811 [Brachionus plicatilis]|uniref:Uncharacterized protein n=1 Tax=Brachionus plicatilis TaxID=10195 RepID=A0A3M7PBK2_BRAPC|nr:hypothetical protein BpHYR1_004811 [Brachionus plicatilis]